MEREGTQRRLLGINAHWISRRWMDGWREKHRGANISVLLSFSYDVAGERAYKDGITNTHVIYFRITLKEIYPPKKVTHSSSRMLIQNVRVTHLVKPPTLHK